ncbi:30S ribosome-binding factor RbfA [Allobaculum mucilyticum]|uniref:30S ribosome-binding factor RbfA n=1 Tax=Allobaculum mucilyticum TaxID=2834459 RepID=UPI001E4460C2|nr:30S ribosome-binding factor RbfA [Allobaculum mucilyticum]
MTLKQDRMDQILKKEISRILQFELKNPKLGFVTVTDVECTRDMSQAKVYVSFLGKQERNDAGMRVLRSSKGFIRSTLAKNIKARKMPDLIFVQDTSLDNGRRIENIISNLPKESAQDTEEASQTSENPEAEDQAETAEQE